MEKRFILRGFGVGALAGLLCFVFARIFVEPVIQRSIDYENGRDAMEDTLRKAAGLAPAAGGPEIFSRGVQRGIGIGTGLVLFGIAMGGLVAVACFLAFRRTHGRIRPRTLAALIAAAGFLGLYLIPFLKYPANPPAIGHPETIRQRTALYVAMVVISLVALGLSILVASRLAPRIGSWNAVLVATAGFVVLIAVAMAILPPVGHLHANTAEYGRYATETPQPLRNARGVIVYPGFPADTLFTFRVFAILNQLLLWGTIGLAFGPLIERVVGYEPDERDTPALSPSTA
jgi:Probable cobalt transporter subunit (CbtA)